MHLSRKRKGRPPMDAPCRYRSADPDLSGTLNGKKYRLHMRKGYVHIRFSGDGKKDQGLHRYMMSLKLGRPLEKHERVHHINGVRVDNRIDNLELWSDSHPRGQRVEDKITWAKEFLKQYGYEVYIDNAIPEKEFLERLRSLPFLNMEKT